MNPLLIKSFRASADTEGRVIAAFSSAEGEVAAASGPSDLILGVVDELGAKSGQALDVIQIGHADVIAGGDVDAGQYVTANSDGHAIVAEPAVDATVRVVG
ncbi:MAG: hypothetical protein AAF141_06030, partial [Pseudomonadota bacterium]